LVNAYEKIVIPNVKYLSGSDRKTTAVGLTNMLCKQPMMLAEPFGKLWPRMLEAVINIFELPEEAPIVEEEDFLDQARQGYNSTFARLAFAHTKLISEHDPFAKIGMTAQAYLAHSLAALTAQHRGKFGAILATLSQEYQQKLVGYCKAANVTLS